MGFGTLFFGYFLLLNVAYYTFTDLISALIMALGLYKLWDINKPFKGAFYTSLMFALTGAFELTVQILGTFNPSANYVDLLSYTSVFRFVIIAVLTLFILMGVESVADEVGLGELAKKTRYTMPFALGIYLFAAFLDIPKLDGIIDIKVLAYLSVFSLLSLIILGVVNLVTIYKAYMKICMPEDKNNDISNEPSKFAFVNKYREHTQQRQKEYIEYKLDKLNKKSSKKTKK